MTMVEPATSEVGTIRAYWRCPDCVTVFATEVPKPPPAPRGAPYGYNLPTNIMYLRAFTPICAVCEVEMTPMGAVTGTGVTLTTVDTVCDWSCQMAMGPHCECPCGGANHGDRWARKIVVLETRGTHPVIRKTEEDGDAAARAAEFKLAVEAATVAIKHRYPEIDRVLAAKAAGRWVPNSDFDMLMRWRGDLKSLELAKGGKVHKSRMARLARLVTGDA